MSAFHDNALMGASGQQGYQISRSVRLRSSASAYFTRTPSSAGSQTTWTWSSWVKRGQLGSFQDLFHAYPGSGQRSQILFRDTDTLYIELESANTNNLTTTQVFRDASAWYHIVVVYDSNNATSGDRVRLYVNGSRVTSFSVATYPSSGSQSVINSTTQHEISSYDGAGYYFDGYLTEVNFIDGQALTPSSFGENDTVTGVWKPKKYTGTYGTNGFYLNFSDNSNNTAATIGKDYSGNGNNWTPNNISVTSGTTYDSMLDVPTMWADGGNGRGNYAVFNPLDALKSSSASVSNGNLTASPGTTGKRGPMGTLGVSSGKWYFEVVETNRFSDGFIGVCSVSTTSTDYPGASSDSWSYYGGNGNKYNGGTATSYGSSYVDNDVIGVAVDMDNGKIWFSKNGTWQASGDPSAGTNAAYTNLSGYTVTAVVGDDSTTTGGAPTFNANFGQRPFTYTPPSGFKALNTQNLPSPTISNGALYMAATTYTGNGASRSITNGGNNTIGTTFQPDMVWIKSRSTVGDTEVYDSVRGATKYLLTDATTAEGTIAQSLTAFNSNGFSLGTGSGANDNTNGTTYIGWQWQAGKGTTSSNTSGSITSTVSVNATAGFSVVTYTGTGANATVGHGLGVAPSMIIIKCRGSATDPSWIVGHTGVVMGTGRLILNGTDANSNAGASVLWNSTAATSTVFSLGNYSSVNQSTLTYVAYCFSAVRGYSAFGSYTGNGSSDGPFVFLGFRPRFVLVKASSAIENWLILDSSTGAYNVISNTLLPNSSGAEATGNDRVDFLSNGFKCRASGGVSPNASGVTYIYAAFAENPLKFSLAR